MSSGILITLSVLSGGLAALSCLIAAFWCFKRQHLIDDTPTSKTQGVFIGLVELKGTAESDTPLTSYLAEVPCVQYAWQIEEHWTRTVQETYRDAQGRTQTHTRTESGWTRIAEGKQSLAFYLKDDTGIIRIIPEKATIQGTKTFDMTCARDHSLYFGKGPEKEIANSDHRRRFQETAIALHTILYVMGHARERQDVVAAEIAHDRNAPIFVISTQTEKQISTGYKRWFWFWLILGLIAAIGSIVVYSFIGPSGSALNWQWYLVAASGYLIAAWLGWIWTMYNSFINLHERVKQAWSQVDVQLKLRNDLIPNLVRTVEGYRIHENETLKLLAELRSQLAATPPGVAGPDFKGMSLALGIVIERYPELKASESFMKLQKELVNTEQRIAQARDYFNEIATFYNIRLEIIPDRFVAALARLHPRSLMGASDFERAEINVQLQV